MLRLRGQYRASTGYPYVCASCLANSGQLLHEARCSIPPANSPRIRHISTTHIPSSPEPKKRPPWRIAKKLEEKRKLEGKSPKASGSLAKKLKDAGSDSQPSRPLRPTSLKAALNTLKNALSNDTTKQKNAQDKGTKVKDAKEQDTKGKGDKEKGDKKKGIPITKKRMGDLTSDALKISTVESQNLLLTPIYKRQPPVPPLSYGLDRVLFNPGVYHLQDPRSRVFNFDPYLAAIMPIQEFDFNSLKQYLTSSKDTALVEMAAQNSKKYAGSTSSMTSMLSHFHFLLSAWRPVNPAHVSRGFEIESTKFTRITRTPSAIFLHWKNGTYAIDADKEFDSANVLSMLGKSMEKLLTLSKDDFEKYRRTNSDQLSDEERNGPESYHYSTMGDFLMRSQLDAHDHRLPGTGMYDLKTRAVVSIRMDAKNFHKGRGYEIRHRIGQWESYEREYYDMVRSAFLKYSLQVRIGRMDGIFVAFHNTQRIFGFQYIPLPEMDLALHGADNTTLGDREFKLSLHLLNKVLDKATARWPNQSLRMHFETRPSDPAFMYVFAKPVTQEEIEDVQTKNRAQVEEFEREMMGIIHKHEDESSNNREGESEVIDDEDGSEEEAQRSDGPEDAETSLDVWEDMMEKVEETLENDELGINTVREAIEDALEDSGLLQMESTEESRRYLDALLEAVTSANEAREAESAVESSEDSVAVEEESSPTSPADGSEDTADRQTDTVSAGEENLLDDKQGVTAPMEGQDNAAGEAADSSAEEESREPPKQASLKDLLVRFASKFQASPVEQRTAAPTPEAEMEPKEPLSADPKLRKFENILSEMMKKNLELSVSRAEQRREEADSDGSDNKDTPSSPESSSTIPEGQKPPKSETAAKNGAAKKPEEKEESPEDGSRLLGMVITVRNKVNGKYVKRPERLTSAASWTLEYAIEELPSGRAERIYEKVLARRRKDLQQPEDDDEDGQSPSLWSHMFHGQLEVYSRKGRLFREREDQKAKVRPVRVYGVPRTLAWSDVFTDEGGPAVPRAPEK